MQTMTNTTHPRRCVKPPRDRAERATISLPPLLVGIAHDNIRALGFVGLSDYVQDLIRRDGRRQPMAQ